MSRGSTFRRFRVVPLESLRDRARDGCTIILVIMRIAASILSAATSIAMLHHRYRSISSDTGRSSDAVRLGIVEFSNESKIPFDQATDIPRDD